MCAVSDCVVSERGGKCSSVVCHLHAPDTIVSFAAFLCIVCKHQNKRVSDAYLARKVWTANVGFL